MCLHYTQLKTILTDPETIRATSKCQKGKHAIKADMPVCVDDIPRIEKLNPSLSISAYELEGMTEDDKPIMRLWRTAPHEPTKTSIQLLLYKGHWMWIKNWDRFCSSKEERCRTCTRCLSSFGKDYNIEKHMVTCYGFAGTRVLMPPEGSTIKFKGPKPSQVRHPVALYADFEALQCEHKRGAKHETMSFRIRVEVPEGCSLPQRDWEYVGPDAHIKFQETLFEIEPLLDEHVFDVNKKLEMTQQDRIDYAAADRCYLCGQDWNTPFDIMGNKALEAYLTDNQDSEIFAHVSEADWSASLATVQGKKKITAKTAAKQLPSSVANILKEKFDFEASRKPSPKCRDHCHVTGCYRGAAHQYCNLQIRHNFTRKNIPVFFHNATGYDMHFMVRALAKLEKQVRLDCIPINAQKFKTLSIGRFKILDSCAFLNSSLDKLLKNLPDDKKTRLRSLAKSDEQFQLINQKLILPYERVTSLSWLEEEISYNREHYHSSLTNETPSEDAMKHLKKVADSFELTTNRDLHDLYLSVDVLGLADVFEEFRDMSLREYQLDPVNYLGLPGFAWDAMLKLTEVELDLLSDVDMHQMIEKSKRGGISMAGTRYFKANNPALLPKLPEDKQDWSEQHAANLKADLKEGTEDYLQWCKENGYDSTQKTTWIWYTDINNLYGYAMSQKLPCNNFRWGDPDTFDPLKDRTQDESSAFLEVDLEYPEELHDEHSLLPMAPESLQIKESMLSEYQLKVKRSLEGKLDTPEKKLTLSKCTKLVPHLGSRKRYVLHAANLKFYLDHGLKLTKLHRVIEFDQKDWMQPWIQFNTAKRAKATSDFEKDFYKLLNNACFGKTMESVRTRTKATFVTKEKQYRKHTGRPSYKFTMDYGTEDFRIVFEEPSCVVLDKPVYAGMAILDTSKIVMYSLLYDTMVPLFGRENIDQGKIDTDSFMLDITTPDLYGKLRQLRDTHLDTSDYPESSEMHSKLNKKVVGKAKDETNGFPIWKRVILKAKCDSFRVKQDAAVVQEAREKNDKIVKQVKKELEAAESLGEQMRLQRLLEKAEGEELFKTDKKVCKGISRSVVKKTMTLEDWESALKGEVIRRDMVSFRSLNHEMFTIKQNKLALTCYDDKRFILDDGIHSRPHGHFRN